MLPMKKIVVVELHQETNSFSKVPTTLREFESLALYYDQAVFTASKKLKRFQIAGFLKAVEKLGKGKIEIVPTVSAWATSGGPVAIEVYNHFKEKILSVIKSEEAIDGIYVSMHGAMGVEGMRDPESDLLREIRRIVGNELPIGVSYDLHANITQEKVMLATFINAYQTNPHRDHFKVGFKAGEILIKTVLGEVKPLMHFIKMPLLKGGGMTIDFLKPMNKIFRWMRKQEKKEGVLCVANFISHIWLDDEEMGWSCIAVTDGNLPLAEQLTHELADLNWAVRDYKHPTPKTIEEAISIVKKSGIRRKFGTVVMCDLSDIVAAGGPGENVHILKALIKGMPELNTFLPFRDEEIANYCYDKKEGETVKVFLGKKLEQDYNHSLEFEGEIVKMKKTEFGKTIVVKHRGIHLFITELPNPAFRPKFFKDLGFSPRKADLVVVKNLFPFRLFFMLYNRKTLNVTTQGTTDLDVFKLKYTKIPRPIYPLDDLKDWRQVP